MCNQQEKLPIFAYTLESLVKLQLDYEYEQLGCASQKDYPEEEYNRALKDFSNTRIMKLLYFTCLESVKGAGDNIDIGLFRYFDRFRAYERGPVEVDIYMLLSMIPGFVYLSGRCTSVNLGKLVAVAEQIGPDIQRKIKDAIEGVKRVLSKEVFCDTQKLVDRSHMLPLWNTARFDEGNEMNIKPWTVGVEKAAFESLS